MKRALAAMSFVALAACASGGSGGSAAPTTLPGDLVPPSAVGAKVSVASAGVVAPIAAEAVAKAVPFLVRRVFDAPEALTAYGLDHPRAVITFAMPDGSSIVLAIGDDDFDKTASYVQRRGDPRVWLVLDASLAPLLPPA